MEAVNIYTYSRIQEDMATEFENILSQALYMKTVTEE
jgi:hypothetical protein